MLLLYTEEQLERAYEIYRVYQIKLDLSFMVLENFRKLYEELAKEILKAALLLRASDGSVHQLSFFPFDVS